MRSWKSMIAMFVLMALSFCGIAPVAVSEEIAPAVESVESSGQHTLWRVSSEEHSIYVAGSIHLLKQENYPLADVLEKAFEESQVLVMEVDPAQEDDPGVQWRMMQMMFLEKGETLEKMIEKETYEKASVVAPEVGIEMDRVQNFKPWLFAMQLAAAKLQSLGFKPDLGLDMYFHGKAVEAGKKVVGLETLEYQLSVLDGLSKIDQDRLVRQTLKDLEVIETEMERVVKAWQTGDLETVNELILKSFREYPVIYEQVITKRTKEWLPEIESMLNLGMKCLIVVGAGHLVGDEGLVELLKKKGYSVEQL